jgi:hypothetical protein
MKETALSSLLTRRLIGGAKASTIRQEKDSNR